MAITTNGGAGVTADAVATLSNKTLEAPVINNATFTGAQAGLEIKFGNNIVLEGTTNDAYELTLTAGDPTADRTITFPNSTGTVALTSDLTSYITASSVNTLSNKTLSSPLIASAVFTDGSILFEGTTADNFETTLAVTDPTADRTITFPDSTGTVALTSDITVTASSTNTFTNKSISLSTNTVTASLAELNTAISDADVASLAGSETLTNKTLTSPTLNTPILKSPEERLTVSATAAASTVQFDTLTQGVLYYTSNATGNWTLNVRGDSGTTLNSVLTTGDSITIVFLATQGSTAYYSNAFTIDGNSVTPKYITGTAFSAGNASSIDSYVYTIIKTGSATYTVLASQTKFA
jgi:hypothetical protein